MNWISYIPPAEEQHSDVSDFLACVSYSAIHCIESQEIKMYGKTNEYSERALAKLSGTTYQGNNAINVFNAILKYGLILEKDWDSDPPPTMTWDEYYADIPQEILAKAVKVDVTLLNGINFDLAPPWTFLLIGGTQGHAVEGLNDTTYFDSYKNYVKSYDSSHIITWQGTLLLKGTNMAQFKTQSKGGELRIVLQADDMDTWMKLCKVYGIDPNAPVDETV